MHQLIQGWVPYIVEDTMLLTSGPGRLVYVEVKPKPLDRRPQFRPKRAEYVD